MKVLVHGFSWLRGGVESYLLSYCGELLRNHPDLTFEFVIYGETPDFARPLIESGCVFHEVIPRTVKPVANYRDLVDLVDEGAYDLLWFNVNTLSDITLYRIAKKHRVKTLVHSHNSKLMGNRVNAFLHHLHQPFVEKTADFVTACSGDAARFLFSEPLVDSARCRVLPNAIDCDAFRFCPEERTVIRNELGLDDQFVVGHTGRFATQKNHEFLLDVFKEICILHSNSKLLLLGSGSEEHQIRKKISLLDLQDSVLLLGSVEDAFRYYSAMDCFVFPSLFEGLGLSLLEAQANGLHCVASDRVPDEAFVKENCLKMSLEESPADWARACLNKDRDVSKRMSAADCLRGRGYDISTSSEELFKLFIRTVSS